VYNNNEKNSPLTADWADFCMISEKDRSSFFVVLEDIVSYTQANTV
jgi:hypothetical protein